MSKNLIELHSSFLHSNSFDIVSLLCILVEWKAPYSMTQNILDANVSVCLSLNEPTRNNLVHMADITKETNVSSDVIISLTTTIVNPADTCSDTGLVISHQSNTICSSSVVSLATCDVTETGSVSNGLLLCSYRCPCVGADCIYGLYYEKYKHYLQGYGFNDNVRELCRVNIVQ